MYRQCPVFGLAIFARDTDGLSRAYLGWNHGQETGGVPYPYPAQHRHPIALASPPLILYSETRHQPVQPSHQQQQQLLSLLWDAANLISDTGPSEVDTGHTSEEENYNIQSSVQIHNLIWDNLLICHL